MIGASKRFQVAASVPFVDDCRGIAQAHEQQVEDEPPGATVAVYERVDLLKPSVDRGERFGKVQGVGRQALQREGLLAAQSKCAEQTVSCSVSDK